MLYIVDVLKERPEKIVSVRTTKDDHEMMLIRLQNNKIYLNWHDNQFSYKETGRIAHYIQRFMKHDDRPCGRSLSSAFQKRSRWQSG